VLRRLTPLRLALAGAALLVVVGLFLWLTPSESYIFLPDEARPVDPLVTVSGGKEQHDGGGIYFVDVFVRKATLLERLFPELREGSTIVPPSAVRPPGVSDSERRKEDLREMAQSQTIAAAVALRELGYKVDVNRTGALIEQVVRGAPADGKLLPSDVVVRANGRSVRTADDLRRVLRARPPGTTFALVVRRASDLTTVRVKTISDPQRPGRPVIGVLVGDAARIELPLKVKIDTGNIGGPSAGLAFALDVMEKLGRDVDRGVRVAATGELELDGSISPIGGIEQKTIGVRRAGVHIFLVPAGDNAREARRYAKGVRIVPVKSFQQALHVLATLPSSD
jgi:PDZ domain-containing protein